MTAPKSPTPVAVLKAPRLNAALILFARTVLAGMRDNPHFPGPDPSLDDFEADVDAFDDSELAAGNKGSGAAAVRDARRLAVTQGLHHLRDYVQNISEQHPYAEAVAIITSAGMRARKASSRRPKPALAAKHGEVSGTVLLIAKAVGHSAVYFWQISDDGEHWRDVGETMHADTTITGLTRGQTYYFRMQTLTRRGSRSDFTQPVSLVVV